jgi:ATP-dependent Clp endopeptidase proteolytic subunit ClpP
VKSKIYIDGNIGEAGFYDGVKSFSLADLNQNLNELSGATELDVYINSGGGSVTEGFAIYDRLMQFDGVVNTIVNGMCASIATVIFQAGKKGKRKMYENSEFFVHNPFWMPTAPEAMEAKDLALLHEDLKKAENRIKTFYSTITGKGVDELTPILDRQTTLTADEAIQLGFVDEKVNTQIAAFTKYKIAAYLNNNNNKMNTEIKNELQGINKFLAKIKSKLFKNAMAETSEGVSVYYDGETLDVGVKLYTDEDMITPAPDGKHTVGEKVYVVADGVVTEVLDVEAEANKEKELEATKAKVAELEAALSAKDAIINEKETVLNETKTEITALASKIKSFENLVATGKDFKAEGNQTNGKPNVTAEPKTALEKVMAHRQSKIK